MTTATTIAAHDSLDVLRAVPRLLGCTPRESLVIVPFGGGRSSGGLRIDLPHAPEAAAEVAATAVGMVCRIAGVESVVVIVYAGAPFRAPDGRPAHADFVSRVRDCAMACGLDVLATHLVAEDGWGGYDDAHAPRPLDELADAASVSDTRTAVDQHAGAALPEADEAHRHRVAAVLDALDSRFPATLTAIREELRRVDADDSPVGSRSDDGVPAAAADGAGPAAVDGIAALSLAELPRLLEDALSWDASDLHPAEAGLLAFVLARPMLRDVALTQWSADLAQGRPTLRWQLAWQAARLASHRPPETPPGPLRLAGEGPRPDTTRLRRALELARRAAAAAPHRERAGALAAAAWLSWALGNSTHASAYVALAQEIDPRHGLASLLTDILSASHLPDWAFSPSGRADAASAT